MKYDDCASNVGKAFKRSLGKQPRSISTPSVHEAFGAWEPDQALGFSHPSVNLNIPFSQSRVTGDNPTFQARRPDTRNGQQVPVLLDIRLRTQCRPRCTADLISSASIRFSCFTLSNLR